MMREDLVILGENERGGPGGPSFPGSLSRRRAVHYGEPLGTNDASIF
jgi:hypothetical protein